MESVAREMESLRATGALSTTTDIREMEYGCPICKDTGVIVWMDERGYRIGRPCECAIRRRNQQRLERSGLAELISSYTLENFQTPEEWQKVIKQKAEDYLLGTDGGWFFIGGAPGSGKTHICTAIMAQEIAAGRECFYVRWREFAPKLKALVNDRYGYDAGIGPAKNAEVLYIDDFFKGAVTDADINLAFELLDFRYGRRKPTVISSERSIEDILGIDEGLGSRIYKRSQDYCLRTERRNWRLRR